MESTQDCDMEIKNKKDTGSWISPRFSHLKT